MWALMVKEKKEKFRPENELWVTYWFKAVNLRACELPYMYTEVEVIVCCPTIEC
jgi:hypothetical protein